MSDNNLLSVCLDDKLTHDIDICYCVFVLNRFILFHRRLATVVVICRTSVRYAKPQNVQSSTRIANHCNDLVI